MITKIEVDGFKSLKDFELTFNPGLNILVGPNGAGKTNIIQFLEFLGEFDANSIDISINKMGGASVLFQKIGENEYVDVIKGKIWGLIPYNSESKSFGDIVWNSFVIGKNDANDSNHYIMYEYSFEITREGLFFSAQELKIKSLPDFIPEEYKRNDNWIFHIRTKKPEEKDIKVTSIEFLKGEDLLSRKVNIEIASFSARNSLLRVFFLLEPSELALALRAIDYDFSGNLSLSIIPSNVVNQFEEVGSFVGINKDGTGLKRTLFNLKASEVAEASDSFSAIEDHLQNANSSILRLEPVKDFDNKILVKVFIKSGNYEAVLPLSAMSDGTIKWLTLITAIYTSTYGLSIEEPENFLHPWMQAEIVSILREHIMEKDFKTFALLTTHSESLINAAEPEELILVDIKDGGTVTRRIENVKGVREEISNSGLGLGYFYFSNILASV